MKLKIVKASQRHAKELLRILEEARIYKLSLGDEAWGTDPYTLEEVNVRINSGNCYVVFVDSVVAGSVMLLWQDERIWGAKGKDETAGYAHGMITSNAFRGKKLGEKIMQWVGQEVKARGRQFIRLDCNPHNIRLCEYYEQQGFHRVGIYKIKDYQAALYERLT